MIRQVISGSLASLTAVALLVRFNVWNSDQAAAGLYGGVIFGVGLLVGGWWQRNYG